MMQALSTAPFPTPLPFPPYLTQTQVTFRITTAWFMEFVSYSANDGRDEVGTDVLGWFFIFNFFFSFFIS